jgi:aminoglycoside phosphotransferase (APT) family kinase protein
MKRVGSISANPNPIDITGFSGTGVTTLSWAATGVDALEVRVGAPDGPLFSRSGPTGSKITGKWVRDGMTFYLQDASSDQPDRAAETLATVTLHADASNFAAALLGVPPAAVGTDAIAAAIQQQLGVCPRLGSLRVRPSMILVCEAHLSKSTVVFKATLDAANSTLALEGWACDRVRKLGVPSPKVLAFDASRQYFPSPYLIMEKVSGQPLKTLRLSPDRLGLVLRQVGRFARLIHSVRLEGFGYLDEALYLLQNTVRGEHLTWRDAVWEHLEGAVYLTRQGLLSPSTLGSLRMRLEQHDALLRHCELGCLLHGDLGSGNTFVNPSTEEVVGIIDFAQRQSGDPAWDLARIALERDPDQLRLVLDAYEPDTTLGRTLPARIALFRPFVVIAYTQWAHRLGLENDIPMAWRPYLDQGAPLGW